MKILVVDDDKLVCAALKTIIEAGGECVCAIAGNGEEAVLLYQRCRPDIVLMDIRMQGKNGMEASQEILRQFPDARILLLTTFSDEEYIVRALQIGVKGYLLKQNYESILPALKSVYSGQNVFDSVITSKLPKLLQPSETKHTDLLLSEKELRVIELVAKGLNNRELAEKLYLSEGTVRNYLSSLLCKLHLRDRTQLAIFYYEQLR